MTRKEFGKRLNQGMLELSLSMKRVLNIIEPPVKCNHSAMLKEVLEDEELKAIAIGSKGTSFTDRRYCEKCKKNILVEFDHTTFLK